MFIEAKDDGGGGDNWTTGAISRAKLQSNHHHQQTNIQYISKNCLNLGWVTKFGSYDEVEASQSRIGLEFSRSEGRAHTAQK